jgi:predicted transcriptional regulator of viral defense system
MDKVMAHLTGEQLRKLVGSEECDYVMLKSILSTYKQPRMKISKWLADGTLIRVKKGFYVFGPACAQGPYCTETLANLLYGPSILSLEYALSFYGIIPERVEQLTSITPKKNKQFNTPVGVFTYQHQHMNKYSVGITQYYMDETHPIFIATPEKALADYFYFRCKQSSFNTLNDMLSFLENDLRADHALLLQLDVDLLGKIQEQYKLPALNFLIKMIKAS